MRSPEEYKSLQQKGIAPEDDVSRSAQQRPAATVAPEVVPSPLTCSQCMLFTCVSQLQDFLGFVQDFFM